MMLCLFGVNIHCSFVCAFDSVIDTDNDVDDNGVDIVVVIFIHSPHSPTALTTSPHSTSSTSIWLIVNV